MKRNAALLVVLTNLVAVVGLAQTPSKLTLYLKNNGLRPRTFRFLERHPADQLPNVFTAFLLPGQSYQVALKAGTSLALVNQPEINATMRGKTVPGQPLLLVQAADNGRTINLVRKAP